MNSQVDEVFIQARKGKNDLAYLWNIMDHDTRFLFASEITEDRTLSSAMKAFRRAASTSANQPYSITTDKYKGYYPAVE